MVNAEFIQPTQEAALHIAEHMRAADVAELAALGATPHFAIQESWNAASYARMVAVDGEPSIVFGVGPYSALTGKGIPWLLATPGLEKVGRRFARECLEHRDEMLRRYPVLFNMVSVDNHVSIRWLSWMGFQFESPQPVGLFGQLFYPFHMRRDH